MAPIGGVGAIGAGSPFLTAGVTGTTAVTGPGSAGGVAGAGGVKGAGGSFAASLVSSLEQVQQLQATSADLGVKAATGDLDDVHDYTIASTQARVATEVTVAVRNKALEAFNDIMRMQV